MTACLFGTYDRTHSATRVLHQALVGAGYRIEECHEPLWEETHDKHARYWGPRSLASLGTRYLAAVRRLAGRWRARAVGPPPLVVVGFNGQLDVLVARRVCRPRAGLMFAPLVSVTETLVEDRRLFGPRSLRGRAARALDRVTLGAADLVLADTVAHGTYLQALAPRATVGVWYLGPEPEFCVPRAAAPVARRVLFYGRCVPLHGIDTVIAAAERLRGRAQFVLIGSGPERPRLEGLVKARGVPLVWRPEVPLTTLPDELAAAAVVLGVFGTGQKAAMVVPNKVYQVAASGRPLVTRDGPALREVLEPGVHCLACPPGDPEALATAVATLLDDPRRAERLGQAARAHVLDRFAPDRQAARLGELLASRFGAVPVGSSVRRAADA